MSGPIRVAVEGFEDNTLEVVPASLTAAKLLLNGQRLKAKRRQYDVTDDRGTARVLKLRPSFLFDPMPVLQVDGKDIHLARPLTALEKIWLVAPWLLVLSGGALGGALGGGAALFNARILRSPRSAPVRHAMCFGLTLLATIVCIVIAGIVQLALHPTT